MTRRLSLKKRLLFSAVATVGFFALLESILAVAGVNPVTDTSDPFVGFSSQVPLFVKDADTESDLLHTAEHRLVWFNDQSFAPTKPKNTRRVFCLGGSTTYGRPFDDRVSFAGWLRELLPAVAPDTNFEVINAGGVSYASYRVANILEELTQYEPDLFVVYSAQNEFLERRTYANMFEQRNSNRLRAVLAKTRCWSIIDRIANGKNEAQSKPTDSAPRPQTVDVLPAEVDEMLNHTVGPADYRFDQAWQQQVVQHYEFNLRRMLAFAKQAGAQIVFVTPGSNLRDCSPFKSDYSVPLTEDQQSKFNTLLADARDAIRQQDHAQALAILTEAAKIDSRYAEMHFLRGQALFAQQKYTQAHGAFWRALNEDVCPLRAVHSIVATIRRVASETDTPLVDYEKQLADRCLKELGHMCIGREHFLDHVHPSIDEHREIALALLETLQRIEFVTPTKPLDDATLASITDDLKTSVDPYEEGVSFRNLAKVYHWAGKFSEALPMAERALSLIAEDAASLFVAGECERLLGNDDAAIEYFDRLLVVEPFHFDAHASLGMLLSDKKEYDVAALHLSLAVSGLLDSWYAHQEYGVVLYHLSEFEKAFDELELANKLSPANQRTVYFLAKTAEQLKKTDLALDLQLELLELEGPTAIAHFEIAKLLEKIGRTDEAAVHFASAQQLDPTLEATPQTSPIPPHAPTAVNHPDSNR